MELNQAEVSHENHKSREDFLEDQAASTFIFK